MKSIGIFQAKTHFPSLCNEVAATGSSVLVRRRGRPVVVISPVPAEFEQERTDILSAWQAWESSFGEDEPEEDFPEVWKHRTDRKSSPLEE